jgi:folate-dependent phosphoribosylglycinamide formyltransferase PurN
MKVLVLSSRTGKALRMLNELYPIHAAAASANVPRGVLSYPVPVTVTQWEKLLGRNFDLVVSLGFMKHIPKEFFRFVPTVNVHPGKLPDFKGRDPHMQALKARADWTAVTIHRVEEELDSGEILVEVPVRITQMDYRVADFEERLRKIAVYATAAFLNGFEL